MKAFNISWERTPSGRRFSKKATKSGDKNLSRHLSPAIARYGNPGSERDALGRRDESITRFDPVAVGGLAVACPPLTADPARAIR